MLLLIAHQTWAEEQSGQAAPCDIPGISIEALPLQGESLCVVNTANAGAQWFLLNPAGNRHIGPVSPGFKTINAIKASGDGRFLAVYSVAEGHSFLDVIDLRKFLQTEEYQVLHSIDPYPGRIELDSWKKGRFYVKSDMLLTHPDVSTGRYSPDMSLNWMETFVLEPTNGRIYGVSEGAVNPIEHYAQVLLDSRAGKAEKDRALVKLLSIRSRQVDLPLLIKILEQEQDPKRMNKLLDEINSLQK